MSGKTSRFVFPRWANYLLPTLIVGALLGGATVPQLVAFSLNAVTLDRGYQPEQPIPFSHSRHLSVAGISDCTYCHNTVYSESHAAIPSADVCIACHAPAGQGGQHVHGESAALQPLWDAWESGRPIRWVRVHDLPDYAYFSHEAHTNAGVGCVSCHGRVDLMGAKGEEIEGVFQYSDLSMAWCLECHRDPTPNLRPLDTITVMDQSAAELAEVHGVTQEELFKLHDIRAKDYMQGCGVCHR